MVGPTSILHLVHGLNWTSPATVRGVDLFPPPVSWVPPNCVLEVDDALQDWTWREPFDLIHMRIMMGSFNASEWTRVYKLCYEYTPLALLSPDTADNGISVIPAQEAGSNK